jgi:hypothetical protein
MPDCDRRYNVSRMNAVLKYPSTRNNGSSEYACLKTLRTLHDALKTAVHFAEEVQREQCKWGVPPLFFFHADSPKSVQLMNAPEAMRLARRKPKLAAGWSQAAELIDALIPQLIGSHRLRNIARAMPELKLQCRQLAGLLPGCHRFAELLSLADDIIATILFTRERLSFRIMARGLVNLGQLQLLLQQRMPGTKPDPRLVAVLHGEPVDPTCNVATIRWQFYREAALKPDGTLPPGFDGIEHWLWEAERLDASVTIVAGPAVYPRQWLMADPIPGLETSIEILETIEAIPVSKAA